MMMVEFIKNLQLFTSLNSGIDMKPKEFFDAVVRMREKQQEYFKTKTSSALTESKRLERVIDDEIERVQRIIHEKQEDIGGIDSNRTALFVFNNGQIYRGCTDGEVDDDGDFCLSKKDTHHRIGLPFDRLLGWAYEKEG